MSFVALKLIYFNIGIKTDVVSDRNIQTACLRRSSVLDITQSSIQGYSCPNNTVRTAVTAVF